MSPLFRGRDEDRDDVADMESAIARLEGLPLAALAAEVLNAGFGSDGPGGPGKPGTLEDPGAASVVRVDVLTIARLLSAAYGGHGVGPDLMGKLNNLVAEGLQVLESALLVRVVWQGGQAHYMATRRGRRILADGSLERVLSEIA